MASDQLLVEIEKAKEVLRASLHLFRGATYGSKNQRAKEAVEDAELLAKHAFRHVDTIVEHGPMTKKPQ